MRLRNAVLVMAVLLAALPAGAAKKAGGYDLFIEGCHLNLPIPDVKGWLALTPDGRVFGAALIQKQFPTEYDELKNQCVAVKGIPLDLEAENKGGHSVHDNETPLTPLVRGPGLRAGKVRMARADSVYFPGHEKILEIPEYRGEIPISLGQKRYLLTLRTRQFEDYQLVLKDLQAKREQVIYQPEWLDMESDRFRLYWAGDLDRDGKLDLILNATHKYSHAFNVRLFLSGKAAKGQLVKEVATRLITGV